MKERLLAHRQLTATGCWEWTKGIDEKGYGRVMIDGVRTRVHRHAYLIFVGEIPEGMHLHHLCENRLCFNPDHLLLIRPGEHKGHHADPLCRRCGRLRDLPRSDKPGQYRCRYCTREKQNRNAAKPAARERQRVYKQKWREKRRREGKPWS